MVALGRDFDTMLERVNASHNAAKRGVNAGRQLSIFMQDGSEIDPELARELLWHLVFYEVFTASPGAYQALVASGNLELLQNEGVNIDFWRRLDRHTKGAEGNHTKNGCSPSAIVGASIKDRLSHSLF